MILSITVNNFLIFSNEVKLSLKANMKIKRMQSNIIQSENINILKTIALYGSNNVGKTCLIRAIASIKNVLLSQGAEVETNFFTDSKMCHLGVTFYSPIGPKGAAIYSYDFKFDSTRNANGFPAFVYENLDHIKYDIHGNETRTNIFKKDISNQIFYYSGNKEIEDLMHSISSNNILVYTINADKFKEIEQVKNLFINFAESIEIIDSNNIPIQKTIEILKNDLPGKTAIKELIKSADLDLNDYKYLKPVLVNTPIFPKHMNVPRELVLQTQSLVNDMFCLISNYRGKDVPSLIYDSTGTKKIAALAGYIAEAIQKGKILVVDELDSSLHFKLTRAIVALFNNELNKNSQLIFTSHDLSLLDCKKLFRKDQIWFLSKQDGNTYLYPLDDFTANDGVRAENNIFELYKKGILGTLPEPDFISFLLENENE